MNKKDWMQTLLSLGLVLPGVAQAIGLGNLVVLSGPGEPFRAEIPIHGAHPNQLSDLSAQLAGSAAYAMIHLPFAQATQSWQFSVRAGDSPAILISSPTPLGPGATPFLVQLNWAGGQMVREYQAYPGTYNVPQQTALPMPAPLASRTPAAAAPSPSSSTGWSKARHYGPVPQGSSLYQIAQQLNGSAQVSQQQAMAALFRANPGAFVQGDPSRLLAGVMLKVPSIHEVRALSPLQAATLLHRKEQVAPVTAKAQPTASTTAVAAPSVSATPVGSPGKVATALSLTSAPALSAAKSAELTPAVAGSAAPAVANPGQAEFESLQKSLKGVETRLAIAQQQLAAQTMEISKMSRNQASSFPPLLWVSLGGNLLLLLLFVWMYRRQEQAANRQREISSKLTALGSAARSTPPATAAPTPIPAPSPVASPAAEATAFAPVITPWEGPASTPVATPAPEVLPAAGVAYAETHAAAPEESASASPVAAGALEMGDDRDGFEVDPLEQADLYQTYGKTEQAINVLQEALESNPRRRELYVRLLTLYADADRRGDFLDLAERMRSRFGPNNPDWQEIAAKGHALFPDNALFREEKSETAEHPAPVASTPELREPESSLEPSRAADTDSEKLDFDFASWGNQAETRELEEEPAWTDAHQKMLDEMNEQFRALDQDTRPALRLADDTETATDERAPASVEETPLVAAGEEMRPRQEQIANAADWDAVGTKLDLAKAYVEMGDSEAARELLMEVQRDGNPDQQDEAMKLLANG
ncbi:FimV/HubP family polar landmark protein [Acidithiobacillus sp. AMEEHan]|uniref:FimV/HubP family polar landmark protein n=1 Tax=Acidithiobacillus sp. AMEEHan TaxID=2994951 RepID=UPI0027E56849|nr:FimV/HubP family polar landmark protein [Acidithiobacillus sp. AMEEHan]